MLNNNSADNSINRHFEHISPFLLAFIDAIPDVIGVQDKSHVILLYNKAGYEFLGVKPEFVKGKKCYELIGREKVCENCATEKTYKTLLPSHVVRFFSEVNTWFDIRSFPVLDEKGDLMYVIEHLRDITLQKQMEDELKKTRKNYQEKTRFLEQLTNNLPGMVYRCRNDSEWTMEYISGKCYELSGYEPDQLLNSRSLSYNDLIVDAYREYVWETVQKAIENKERFLLEYQIKTSDGEIKWVWEKGTGVYDINGAVQGLEGFIMDITPLKENQRELIKAKEKAEESDRLKSSFLANVSHELRTPLNGLIGFAELIAKKDLQEEKKRQYLEIIKKSGNQLLTFINNIIDISRIETGQVEVSRTVFHSDEVLRNVHKFFVHQAELSKTNIVIGKADSVILNSDETMVRHIFNNLVSNAIKFTTNGTIELGGELKGDFVEFYVRDTGCGIKEEDMEVIFERFRQGESSKSMKIKGSGLGLPIARNYCDLLGGKLWAESVLGKGSCFYFTIPYK